MTVEAGAPPSALGLGTCRRFYFSRSSTLARTSSENAPATRGGTGFPACRIFKIFRCFRRNSIRFSIIARSSCVIAVVIRIEHFIEAAQHERRNQLRHRRRHDGQAANLSSSCNGGRSCLRRRLPAARFRLWKKPRTLSPQKPRWPTRKILDCFSVIFSPGRRPTSAVLPSIAPSCLLMTDNSLRN